MTTIPLSPQAPRPGRPSLAPYGYAALSAALVLSTALWFLIAISGDVHYAIEPLHHHLETFMVALLGVHVAVAIGFAVRRIGPWRR